MPRMSVRHIYVYIRILILRFVFSVMFCPPPPVLHTTLLLYNGHLLRCDWSTHDPAGHDNNLCSRLFASSPFCAHMINPLTGQ
jgi:hypothetical protein